MIHLNKLIFLLIFVFTCHGEEQKLLTIDELKKKLIKKERKPPLNQAVTEDNIKKIIILIKQGEDINGKDAIGWTPLHEAA